MRDRGEGGKELTVLKRSGIVTAVDGVVRRTEDVVEAMMPTTSMLVTAPSDFPLGVENPVNFKRKLFGYTEMYKYFIGFRNQGYIFGFHVNQKLESPSLKK